MKLKEIRKLTGEIELLTPMHIGGSKDDLQIGGIDSRVVKDPVSGEAYIPGSSLKGKLRSQMEKVLGLADRGFPCGCGNPNCKVCVVFGAHRNINALSAPTRIIIRDAYFTDETKKMYNNFIENNREFYEEKAENSINRIKGTAESPRFIERVPKGSKFILNIVLNIFENDNGDELEQFVKKALGMVEESYLGGSGSRGYGQVKFNLNETKIIHY